MCYGQRVQRIGIRELRNQISRAVRRAAAGERLIITVDGKPAAQLGPLNDGSGTPTLEDLIAAGLVVAPRTTSRPPAPNPRPAPPGPSTTEIIRRDRER
jgi:prevent-host-death family protein